MKTNAGKKARAVLYHGFVWALGFLMLYPILWLVASSFKPNDEIFTNAASLIPSTFTINNYFQGWKGFGGITFTTFFQNSLFITLVTVVGQVAASTLVAYGFARIRFVCKKLLFGCLIATMLLPTQILTIPQYIMFQSFGWLNTYLPLLVPAFTGLPFFIFLIMQFIQGIPKALDESAFIDGCGKVRTFFYIIIPLVKPAIATSAIFSFYWRWDEFLAPLLYLQSTEKFPVSLAIKAFADPSSVSDWGAMFAMLTVSLIPSFIMFILFQKNIVEGISTSGMKG